LRKNASSNHRGFSLAPSYIPMDKSRGFTKDPVMVTH
jgi:hypothetical protein